MDIVSGMGKLLFAFNEILMHVLANKKAADPCPQATTSSSGDLVRRTSRYHIDGFKSRLVQCGVRGDYALDSVLSGNPVGDRFGL